LDFLTGSVTGFCAWQNALTGQRSHFGFRGTQMSAPRSRSAELNARLPDIGQRFAARCQSVFRPATESIDLRELNTLAKTRAVFVSTIGTDWLKAKLPTACAV